MIATGSQGFQVRVGRPPAASQFAAKWKLLVEKWVHAPIGASRPGSGNVISKATTGTVGSNLGIVIGKATTGTVGSNSGIVIGRATTQTVGSNSGIVIGKGTTGTVGYNLGNVIGSAKGTNASNLGGGILTSSSGLSANLGGGIKVPPLSLTPTLPNLWVEKGVIWQLPNLLIGFTSYSAATTFFSSVASFGYKPAPSSWYAGSPFSATDFPMLHWGTKGIEINGFILVWGSLTAISFASTFLPMIPVNQPLIPSPASSAGPVVSTSIMANFSADSPSGVQTFQAKYVMYGPFGPNPLSGLTTSASGIQYDMILYSWWYNF